MKQIDYRNRRRGAAVIEASLTLTVFLLIMFSLFDFGYTLFLHQTIVHRVRAAARYGAIFPTNLDTVKNYVVYNGPTGRGPGMFGLQPSNVTVTRTDPGTTADRINVTVSNYRFSFVTLSYAGSKTGKAIVVSLPVEGE
jgi:Flp pilus assembly protein TadG